MHSKKKVSRKVFETKRSLEDFLADEDGFVKKETILKVGLATISVLGLANSSGANAPPFCKALSEGHTSYNSWTGGDPLYSHVNSSSGTWVENSGNVTHISTAGAASACPAGDVYKLDSQRGCFDLSTTHASQVVQPHVFNCY